MSTPQLLIWRENFWHMTYNVPGGQEEIWNKSVLPSIDFLKGFLYIPMHRDAGLYCKHCNRLISRSATASTMNCLCTFKLDESEFRYDSGIILNLKRGCWEESKQDPIEYCKEKIQYYQTMAVNAIGNCPHDMYNANIWEQITNERIRPYVTALQTGEGMGLIQRTIATSYKVIDELLPLIIYTIQHGIKTINGLNGDIINVQYN